MYTEIQKQLEKNFGLRQELNEFYKKMGLEQDRTPSPRIPEVAAQQAKLLIELNDESQVLAKKIEKGRALSASCDARSAEKAVQRSQSVPAGMFGIGDKPWNPRYQTDAITISEGLVPDDDREDGELARIYGNV